MAKKQSKIEQVIALCSRKSGTTLADIMDKLSVTQVAASSLIGDARRKGVNIKSEKSAAGKYRYYVHGTDRGEKSPSNHDRRRTRAALGSGGD